MKTTRKRKPEVQDGYDPETTSTTWEHAVIDKFLQDALASSKKCLDGHRAAAMADRTDRLAGIILYFRHQVSFLNDLIARNNSSAAHESSTRPRRRRRTDR